MPELKRVLYVEDEPDIQAVARAALEVVAGFELKVCSLGQEALDAVPDLFLLDVMMPGMDSPVTLKVLHEVPELEKTPAIFMTAKVQPDEVDAFKALGTLDVIAKPFQGTPVDYSWDLQALSHRPYKSAGNIIWQH